MRGAMGRGAPSPTPQARGEDNPVRATSARPSAAMHRALHRGCPGAEGLASRPLLPGAFARGKQTGLLEGGGGGNANSFIHYSLVYK